MVSTIFFPLRSNAHSLLAGPPANSVRKRLKIASLLYDEVLIDDGALDILAGPEGASIFPHSTERVARWQTGARTRIGSRT